MTPTQVFELVEIVEGEVNNGGFDQFFYNSSGNNTAETIQALETIGAPKTADIIRRAAMRFKDGIPPKDRAERFQLMKLQFPESTEFDDLDAEFWAYPEDVFKLAEEYKARNGV